MTSALRLAPRGRKAVLVVHIISAGAWVGIDVVLAVLVGTAFLTDNPRTAGLSYQALELFAIWPLLTTGLLCLASGIVLGLGTRYGLVRYWWVAVKLVIAIVFVMLVPLALRPTVSGAADYGRSLASGDPVTAAGAEAAGSLIFPVIVSPTGLLIAMILAVYKPPKRIRRRSR